MFEGYILYIYIYFKLRNKTDVEINHLLTKQPLDIELQSAIAPLFGIYTM